MARPFKDEDVAALPMVGGSLRVRFQDIAKLQEQRDMLLKQQGIFVLTKGEPKPFCEFELCLELPDGTVCEPMPARCVQVHAFGDSPGMMVQLMRLGANLEAQVDACLSAPAEEPSPQSDWEKGLNDLPDFDENGEATEEFESLDEDESLGEDESLDEDEAGADDKDDAFDGLVEKKQRGRRPDDISWTGGAGLNRVELLDRLRAMTPNERSRLAKRANRVVRSILMRDNEPLIIFFLLKNPHITRAEVIDLSKMPTLNHQSITAMLGNRQWAGSEELRYNLVRNPKTPLNIALKLVGGLNMKHLRELAKDWGQKTQIKQMALRLVVQRSEG